MNTTPHLPPHNPEAERAAIGCLLINPESWYEMRPLITASTDFYIHRHQWVWEAIQELIKTGQPVDLLTVADALERKGKLEEAGGSAWLTSLINDVPTSLNAAAYASIVHQDAERRAILKLANEIAQAVHAGSAADDLRSLIRNQLEERTTTNGFVRLSHLLSDLYDQIETAEANPREIWGLPIGFPKFDRATGGLEKGTLTWLAGEPGIGKTWSLTQSALKMGEVEPGLLISMEMKNESIARRALSGVSGIRTKSMKSGLGLPGDWRTRFDDAAAELANRDILIDDANYTTEQLRVVIKSQKRERNIGWFAVDYAMLFSDRAENDNVRTEIISRNLKLMCKEMDLVGVVLQSVTKSGMDGDSNNASQKSAMRGSGQQVHDADNILFLTPFTRLSDRDDAIREEDKKRIVTLHTKKGRELETRPVMHLVRRDDSPFFDEFDHDLYAKKRLKGVPEKIETHFNKS
jgi:replicative DNA helicase